MSLRRYDTYRDSGVEWLGQIPGHWSIQRLGFHFDERREKVSDADFPPLSVTKNGIVPQLETAAKTDDGDNRKKVLAGDFVINSRSDRKGSAGLSELDGSVSLINTVLTPRPSMHRRFVHYLLRSVAFQEEFYRYGKGIVADLWSTNYSEMRNIILVVPTPQEQAAIAAFLNRETAKIDALVDEQRRLIALLKEKRQAVISHAVTKGLDPSAPMKDSGVEWLGKVPAHWGVISLRRATVAVQTGTTPSESPAAVDVADGVPWFTPGDFMDDFRLLNSAKQVERSALASGEARSFPPGAVLVVGIGATLGRVGCSNATCSANQQINAIVPDGTLDSWFLTYALASQQLVMRQLSNASTIGIMNQDRTKELRITRPPLTEQREIVGHLSKALGALHEMEVEIEAACTLLQERRTALISAAVTGKIDVREPAAAPIELEPA